jgi:hypothetical protein
VIDVNKKVLGIAVLLLAVAMLATPVLAKPTKGQKVPVEWYILGFSSEPGEGYSIKTFDCGIQIRRNLIVTFDPILLVIDGSSTPLVGTVVNNVDGISNPAEGTALDVYKMDMSFSTGGGFKGYSLAIHKEMFTPDWTLKWDIVLQGYGEFEGQTLWMSREGPYPSPPGTPVTGYLLKP